MATYSYRDAARILKVNPSRLRYWDRTELVHSRAALDGAGGYDFRDLVCVKGILSLLQQGVSLQQIRRSVDALRETLPEIEDPVRELRLWAEGSQRVVVDHAGALFEPDGQLVLDFRESSEASEELAAEEGARPVSLSAVELFEEGCRLDGDPATYAEAIEIYRKGIEADPEFADLHCNLGAVYYNRRERERARDCFERCLELAPGHVEAHFNLGNLLEEEGRDHMALHHYRVALASDPFCVDLHINLALLYEKLGSPTKARDHWKRYLQLDPAGAWAEVARQRTDGSSKA